MTTILISAQETARHAIVGGEVDRFHHPVKTKTLKCHFVSEEAI